MFQITSVNFDANSDTSNPCDLGINQVVGFYFGNVATASTATLKVSWDGVNFYDITPALDTTGATYTMNISDPWYRYVEPSIAYAIPRFIQLILDSADPNPYSVTVITREV